MSSVPRLETVVGSKVFFDDGTRLDLPETVVAPRIFSGFEELVTEPSRWLFHRTGADPRNGYPLYEGSPINAVQAVVENLQE